MANLQISEVIMDILDLFLGVTVLLGCIPVTIDFDALCTLWVFTVNVAVREKPGF